MTSSTISLTDQIDITSGAHILYLYDSIEGYIDNAAAFIQTGLQLGQYIVLIDDRNNYKKIMERLNGTMLASDYENIYFIDHKDFYYEYGTLHVKQVLQNLDALMKPLLDNRISVRSWGHVYWENERDVHKQLLEYECLCDSSVSELGILGVCIYDGRKLPAAVLNKLLPYHEYMMTDTQLAKSHFYNQSGRTVHLPSLSVHSQMQSEVDLYKQKLEFAHVVSHEVRNPLTVIKAYATMLQHKAADKEAMDKLKAIVDYVDVIDNEITHIINTEQMLSTESLWNKSRIDIAPILHEVLPVMVTKSRTQNMMLCTRIELGAEAMTGNVMGLKLIISNLLSNAIKYSNEGGRICFEAYAADSFLEVVIKDEGIGMSKQQTSKLFQKYEKMNHERSGQGIGLFMVKKLIEHLDGSIVVDSEQHRGTRVTVRLPLLVEKGH